MNDSHIWEALLMEFLNKLSYVTRVLPLFLVIIGSNIEAEIGNHNTWGSSTRGCAMNVDLQFLFIDQIVESIGAL